MTWLSKIGLVMLCLAITTSAVYAQTTTETTEPAPEATLEITPEPTPAFPSTYVMTGVQHIWQGWNNCGPATLVMGLTYFGAASNQYPAAAWLKPSGEDKNVSPWQMAAYVNTQHPGTTRALVRHGGTLEILKAMITNGFPVIIEAGYDPETDDQGWMGHYLLVVGYDDNAQTINTMDSYLGANRPYPYDYLETFWQHFNRQYIVLYDMLDEDRVMELLGDDADETQNYRNALKTARAEATADPQNPFAWFNMGTNFLALGHYNEAAVAYDQARNVGGGLPWRMLWYQFGPFEAYYHTERYHDMLTLAQQNLSDGGGMYVEETFYYGGLAREALGDTQAALENYRNAASFNPNFHLAVEARDRLQNS